jgi:hypothetical protein
MLKTKPRRGAFDYLLDGMHDLPPRPPERGGGGPQRIRIEIEIVDRRAQPARRSRGGVLQFLVALILLSLLFGVSAMRSLPTGRATSWGRPPTPTAGELVRRAASGDDLHHRRSHWPVNGLNCG